MFVDVISIFVYFLSCYDITSHIQFSSIYRQQSTDA